MLFDKYRMDSDMTKIKIYNIRESLKHLPKSIKEIKFDRDVKDDINGKIPDGTKKIIFGGKFNKKVNDLPKSIITIELGKNGTMILKIYHILLKKCH